MPKMHFHGRIVHMTGLLQANNRGTWSDRIAGLSGNITLQIDNTRLVVTVDAENITMENLAIVYVGAVTATRTVIDVLTFQTGHGISFVFETVIFQGKSEKIAPRQPQLAGIATALDDRHDETVNEIGGDPQWLLALHDLTEAIRAHDLPEVNCARAIEGIRNLIAPGKPERQQWEIMQAALQADKAYLTFITNQSQERRHGKVPNTSPEERSETVVRSWVIMNRYIEYRKRGCTPLDQAEFALLKG